MNDEQLYAMRHSLAHIMAQAVQHMWPEAKFGVGPVVENGFYYDIDLGDVTISESDFKKIEKEMRAIVNKDYPFERSEKQVDDALNWARGAKQPYKEELLNDLKRAGTTSAKDIDPAMLGTATDGESAVEKVSFYTDGDFTDLCRGPHAESTGKVGEFKLMRVAGAYWRGRETNPQMQRLYGAAFATQAELDDYLTMLEEAKKRDHRKLGQELDLFVFSDLVGPGLPLWTPRGTALKNALDAYVQELRDSMGFQQVSIPHITKKDLYEKSGHWQKFADELFRIQTREGHEFAMKPMNCPHHAQLYASQQRSYRDLPVRYRETTMVYRDEQSGELGGLSRVRGITQDDAHIFCRVSQVEDEVRQLWNVIEQFYTSLGFGTFRVRLSTHDPAAMSSYAGAPERWQSTVEQLSTIIRERVGEEYITGVGEAAFYGPKIDFMARDAIGREHQLATIQLDFNQPEGFDLSCVNEEGEAERIVMLHCAVMGSHERFLSVYIEHTAGRFPLWCAPEQVRIATVNQEETTLRFVADLEMLAKDRGIRFTTDNSSVSVGKKIRSAETAKVPYTLVIGDKEVAERQLTPRIRADLAVSDTAGVYNPGQFFNSIHNESRGRVSKSSL
ncbi:MAG: threonine--tRNA ligase [Acidobacteriota bacterium]